MKELARIKFSSAVKTGGELRLETQQSNNLEFEKPNSAVEITVERNRCEKGEEVVEQVKESFIGLALSTATVDYF